MWFSFSLPKRLVIESGGSMVVSVDSGAQLLFQIPVSLAYYNANLLAL